MANKDPLVNLGRNVAPDQWKDFGDWGSGSKSVENGSAWSSVIIDMTQYSGLILRVDPGDTFATDAIKIQFNKGGNAAAKKIQWGAINAAASTMQEFDSEDLANALASNQEVYLVFQDEVGFSLLGMDDLCISLTNNAGGLRTMNSIEYRRTGFKPAG
jgi:hypothetical protein